MVITDRNDLEKLRVISSNVNFLLGESVAEHRKIQNVYTKEVLLLKQALSLCSSMVDEKTRLEAACFETVRTMIVRLTAAEKPARSSRCRKSIGASMSC